MACTTARELVAKRRYKRLIEEGEANPLESYINVQENMRSKSEGGTSSQMVIRSSSQRDVPDGQFQPVHRRKKFKNYGDEDLKGFYAADRLVEGPLKRGEALSLEQQYIIVKYGNPTDVVDLMKREEDLDSTIIEKCKAYPDQDVQTVLNKEEDRKYWDQMADEFLEKFLRSDAAPENGEAHVAEGTIDDKTAAKMQELERAVDELLRKPANASMTKSEALKKAFITRAKKHHPDVVGRRRGVTAKDLEEANKVMQLYGAAVGKLTQQYEAEERV